MRAAWKIVKPRRRESMRGIVVENFTLSKQGKRNPAVIPPRYFSASKGSSSGEYTSTVRPMTPAANFRSV